MFVIEGISKKYHKRVILQEISFQLHRGECVGILGVNGCGKTTLLSVLAGVIRPDSGVLKYAEKEDKEPVPLSEKMRSRLVGYVPQGTPLLEELTARDNLRLWYSKKELEQELSTGVLKLLGIDEFLSVPVSKMSGGMKKRVSIGCSVSSHPELLLLDEAAGALDFICKEKIYEYLEAYKKAGGTILLTSHDTEELSVCNRWYLLKDGKLTPYQYDGNRKKLVQDLR